MEPKANNEQNRIMEDVSDFLKVSCTKTFLDKSMFIDTVLKTGRRLLITAPKGFFKSTNMNMLKQFLSVHSPPDMSCFKKLKIYELSNGVFDENYHNWYVLSLNFTPAIVGSYSDALSSYKWAIHKAFREQYYLLLDSEVGDDEKNMIRSWCDMNVGYKNKREEDVLNDLSSLVRIMSNNGRNKVAVLVDDYDGIVNRAFYKPVTNKEYKDIIELTSAILEPLLKNNKNVSLGVLTGVSTITTLGLQDINNLEIFPFLDDHPFVPFFGMTSIETNEFLKSGNYPILEKDVESENYILDEYLTKAGIEVFNPILTLKCLKNNSLDYIWSISDEVSGLISLARYQNIFQLIDDLLQQISLNLENINAVCLQDVMVLKNAYSQKTAIGPTICVFLGHLFEQGLLTFSMRDVEVNTPDDELQEYPITVANTYVYDLIFQEFKKYIIKINKLGDKYLEFDSYDSFVEAIRDSGVVAWKFPNSEIYL